MTSLIRMNGKTQKGKNRVREHGEIWVVLREADRVIFDSSTGPWAFIAPRGLGRESNGSRWVNLRWDRDFQIEELD